MNLTLGQQHALQVFNSGANILLLGDSGTGKSTLISTIVETATVKGLKVARTASTGIAAQLIGGRTIHSFLKTYPGMSMVGVNYISKAINLSSIDILILDEISMVGKTFVEYLYNCLLFAGHHIQLIFVGDFFQLPPTKDGYAFTSPYWNMLNLTPCLLTEVIRQKDAEFISNINMLKYGDNRCLRYLLSHSSPVPLMGQISICAKKEDAQIINKTEIDKLIGDSYIYVADYLGDVYESDLRVEKELFVKQGMRIMSVINGPGYSNGSIGTVTNLDKDSVEVLFDRGNLVRFSKVCFTIERKDILGATTDLWQIPLCPAYAITIHKSQGQTFQYVNIDGTKCWAPGQLYVAVSRARSIEGIHFLTPIREGNIKTDPNVIQYVNSLRFRQ